nr:immunoglobulin light chain junction region [Macaca mulatta]
CQQYYTTPYSV